MNDIRLKTQIKYNPKVHDKAYKEYTTKEIELIKNRKNSLAWLAVNLGRTAKAIAAKRYLLKKESR